MRATDSTPIPMRPRVLVLGAAGRFGSAACQAFAARGWQVIAQARKTLPPQLASQCEPLTADALDVQKILQYLEEHQIQIDLIVHALNPDYARWEKLLPPVTAAVIAIAKHTGATVMVPGNVYNFGSELPAQLSEDTPFVPNTAKARQRIAMESGFEAATAEGVRTIIIRAGDFIGGQGTWLDMAIAKSLDRGVFTRMGQPHLAHAWAYIPDLADTFALVAQHRARLGKYEVFHYSGITASQNDLQSAFESLLGQRLRTKEMPWSMMRVLGIFSPLIRAVVSMRYLWQRPHQLRGDKLMRLVGPLPQTSLQQVLREYLPEQRNANINNVQSVA